MREIEAVIYSDKIAESGRRLIRRASEEARKRNHKELTPEHLFVAIAEVERSWINEILQSFNLDPQVVIQEVETSLGPLASPGFGGLDLSRLRNVFSDALLHARKQGRTLIESTDLFYALFTDVHSYSVQLLGRLGADREMVLQKIGNRR